MSEYAFDFPNPYGAPDHGRSEPRSVTRTAEKTLALVKERLAAADRTPALAPLVLADAKAIIEGRI